MVTYTKFLNSKAVQGTNPEIRRAIICIRNCNCLMYDYSNEGAPPWMLGGLQA